MRRRVLQPMRSDHINVTPLIDVIMCLVIFFLLCSQFEKNEAKSVSLPLALRGQIMTDPQGQLLINLLPHDGCGATAADAPDIFVRDQKIASGDLTAFLRQVRGNTPNLKVVIRADKGLAYDWISPVLVACAQANITSVNFSTREKE